MKTLKTNATSKKMLPLCNRIKKKVKNPQMSKKDFKSERLRKSIMKLTNKLKKYSVLDMIEYTKMHNTLNLE